MRIAGTSLHRRLPLVIAATTVTTVAAFGIFAYRSVRSSAIASTDTRLRSAAAEISSILGLGAVNVLQTLGQVANDRVVIEALSGSPSPPSDALRRALATLGGKTGSVVAVELLDRSGRVRASTNGAEGAVSGLKVAPNDTAARIGPFYQRDSLVLFQGFAPVRMKRTLLGEVRVTRQTATTNANQRVLASLVGREAELLLGNRDGSLWLVGTRVVKGPLLSNDAVTYDREGRRWISSTLPIKNMPWAIAAELPERTVLATARAVLVPFIIVGTLLSFVGAVLGAWLSRTVTHPLVQLTAAAEAIDQGDLAEKELAVERTDEIGRLARAFTAMSESIRGNRDRLEAEIAARTSELRAALSQLRDAQDDVLRKERLAAIGRLSASIGHELRNPLAVMANCVYLIEESPESTPRLKEYAALLREQIRISQRIISDVLSNVHSTMPVRSPVNIADLIDVYLRPLSIPASIRIERNVQADLPFLIVDPDQVGRVLVNLISNAVQAMEDSADGGILTLRAETRDGRVVIEISDTGPGVPEAMADRIFEPLYTTKARGIGLGLSVAREMARANGGDLRLRVRQGRGACFVFELPIRERDGLSVVSHVSDETQRPLSGAPG